MSLLKACRLLSFCNHHSIRSFTLRTAHNVNKESLPHHPSVDNRKPKVSRLKDASTAPVSKEHKLSESTSCGYNMAPGEEEVGQVAMLKLNSATFIPGLTTLQPQWQLSSQLPAAASNCPQSGYMPGCDIPGLTTLQPPSQPSLDAPTGLKAPRNTTAVPSKASGGVPNPSPFYLTQAFLNPFPLPQPRRILLVIDLNGTLLFRPNKRRPFSFTKRPHATEFLTYCLDTFYVAIWSSARPENVSRMVAQLLTPKQVAQCLLVWGRDTLGLSTADYDNKVQVYKRLTKVWSEPRVMSAHPSASEGGKWDQTNTVLIDDSSEKGRSEPFNLLQLPEFSGHRTEPPNVLPQVHDYLNLLCHQGDISRYIHRHPFKLDPQYELPEASP